MSLNLKTIKLAFLFLALAMPLNAQAGLKTSSEANQKNRDEVAEKEEREKQNSENLNSIKEIIFDQNKIIIALIEENKAIKAELQGLNMKFQENNKITNELLSIMKER